MNHAVEVIGRAGHPADGKADKPGEQHVVRSAATRSSPPPLKISPVEALSRTPLQDCSNISGVSPRNRSDRDEGAAPVTKTDGLDEHQPHAPELKPVSSAGTFSLAGDANLLRSSAHNQASLMQPPVPSFAIDVEAKRYAGSTTTRSLYSSHSNGEMAGISAEHRAPAEDVVNDILSIYSSSQGRKEAEALPMMPLARSLPMNHLSLFSGSGGAPSAYGRDPKAAATTNFGDALRMSMNDVDVLGGGSLPMRASAAGRASPAFDLRGSLNDVDMLGSAPMGSQSIWASAAGEKLSELSKMERRSIDFHSTALQGARRQREAYMRTACAVRRLQTLRKASICIPRHPAWGAGIFQAWMHMTQSVSPGAT